MKVYDCFTFYNEFELLELRLKSLWDMVDYFVIVEADKTQNNVPKPYYFMERAKDFKEFLPKIRYISLKVQIDYKGVGDWQIENGQRNAIMYGLKDAEPDDLIFVSDVDEFPAPDILQRINENRARVIITYPITLPLADGSQIGVPCLSLVSANELLKYIPLSMNQTFHWYYFDWRNVSRDWQGTILTKRRYLTTPQSLRDMRTGLPRIMDGGWHFTSMGGVDRIIKKLQSTVEGDEAVRKSSGKLIDREHVINALKNGLDVWDRNDSKIVKLETCDISNINLPYLKDFVKKYPYFLREHDFGKNDL